MESRYIVRKGKTIIANVADPVQACNICRQYSGSYVVSTKSGKEIYHNMDEYREAFRKQLVRMHIIEEEERTDV